MKVRSPLLSKLVPGQFLYVESTIIEGEVTLTVQACPRSVPVSDEGDATITIQLASSQCLYVLGTSDKGEVSLSKLAPGQFLYVLGTSDEGEVTLTVQVGPWSVTCWAQ